MYIQIAPEIQNHIKFQRPPSIVESDYMDGKPNGFTYNAAPEPNDIGFDKGIF